MNKISESQIKSEIRCELSKHGIMTFNMSSGKFLSIDGKRIVKIGVNGMSDLLCIFPDGQTGWIETKRAAGGVKRKDQENFIEAMKQQGCKAGFAKSIKEALDICEINQY